jgi:hypothetical protein
MIGTMIRAAAGSAHHRPKRGVEQQPAQQDGRQVRAELGLFGVRVHGGTAQSTAHPSLGRREKRHHHQRHAGQNNSGNAVLGSFLGPQIHRRFVSDVSGQGEKTGTDNLQGASLVPFASLDVCIDRHAPQQRSSGGHFDEAIDSEADKRNAACERTGNAQARSQAIRFTPRSCRS